MEDNTEPYVKHDGEKCKEDNSKRILDTLESLAESVKELNSNLSKNIDKNCFLRTFAINNMDTSYLNEYNKTVVLSETFNLSKSMFSKIVLNSDKYGCFEKHADWWSAKVVGSSPNKEIYTMPASSSYLRGFRFDFCILDYKLLKNEVVMDQIKPLLSNANVRIIDFRSYCGE